MKRLLPFLILCGWLLAACGPVTPVNSPATPTLFPITSTPSPTTTVITPVRTNLEPITPENVSELKQVEIWGKGKIYDAQLSLDGTQLAVLTPKGIYIYDTENYEEQFLELKVGDGGGLGFKPDGSEIAYGSDNIYFWNLRENKAELGKRIPNRIPNSTFTEIQYSPDGQYLITQSRLGNIAMCEGPGGNLALYEIGTGKLLFEKDFCVVGGAYFRVTADNKTYMFFTIDIIGGPAWKIFVLETSSGRILDEIEYPYETKDERIFDVSPSGSILSLRAIDFNGMETRFSSRLVDAEAYTSFNTDLKDGFVVFTRVEDRRWVIKGSYDDMSRRKRIYELQDSLGNLLCSFPQTEVPFSWQFSADGNIALTRVSNSEILLWQVGTCKPLKSFHFPDPDRGLVFTPNGEHLITTNSWTVYDWDVATGEYKYTVPIFSVLGNKPPFGISEDGSSLFTLSENRDITDKLEYEFVQIDLETGMPVKKFGKGGFWTKSIEVSSFQTIATIRSYSSVAIFELWDPEAGTQIASFKDESLLIAYSPDKSRVAIGKRNGIMIVDLKTGDVLHRVDLPSVNSIGFSTSAKLFASVFEQNPKQISLYEIDLTSDSPQPIKIGAGGCYLMDLVISKNFAACRLEYGQLRVWDLNNLNSEIILLGHSYVGQNSVYVTSVMFNLEGTMLLSLSSEYSNNEFFQGVIRFWELPTGRLVQEIRTPYHISEFDFSPDSRFLATTSSDGLIRLWGVPRKP